MAIEERRGCGYRKVGKLYLVGGVLTSPCDRLPIELKVCPICGEGIRVTRSLWKINAFKLWGNHAGCYFCNEKCFVCYPPGQDGFPSYILGVGTKFYSPEEFVNEAREMGVSKAIPFVPKELVVGKTVIFLSHPTGIEIHKESHCIEKKPAVVSAFIPFGIEQLVWESQLTDEMRKDLEKRGITPVSVPDGDGDHAGRKGGK